MRCPPSRARRVRRAPLRVTGATLLLCVATAARGDEASSRRFEAIAGDAARATGTFRPAGDAALDAAAANLRSAMAPLERLLARSKSGADWRKYLDWESLQAQASTGQAADPKVLRDLEKKFAATETGLDMPDFVRVRKARSEEHTSELPVTPISRMPSSA